MRLRAALVVLALAACRVPIAELTVVQTLEASPPLVRVGAATGRSCRWWALGVPLGLPRIDEAVHDALRERGGTLLRDVRLRSVHPVYGPVGRHCYTVAGTAWGPGLRHAPADASPGAVDAPRPGATPRSEK